MRFGYDNFDQKSYEIGIAGCFIEMVAAGVKALALSTPLTDDNKSILLPACEEIASGYNVKIYVESKLLDTNLSPDGYNTNKTQLIFYKDDKVLEEYKALKAKEKELKDNNLYTQDEKDKMSVLFCRLLSYPEDVIMAKYAKKGLNQDVML